MLTPEVLEQRIRKWSQGFAQKYSVPKSSPIYVYQEVFALLHELKSSVQVTVAENVHTLEELIVDLENKLRTLAHDENELNKQDSLNLHQLSTSLESLESIFSFFSHITVQEVSSTSQSFFSNISEDLVWDSFSRARASSCLRHGYRFFKRELQIALTELKKHDADLNLALSSEDSILILRTVRSQSDGDENKEVIQLNVTEILAAKKTTPDWDEFSF